jgi:hypothetical protein
MRAARRMRAADAEGDPAPVDQICAAAGIGSGAVVRHGGGAA